MKFGKVIKKLGVLTIVVGLVLTGFPLYFINSGITLLTPEVEAATEIFTTSGSWQAPEGVTSVAVEAWAGGGAGGGRGSSSGSSGGGGGGAYASGTATVVPGNAYNYTVGGGGVGGVGNGQDGGDSLWDSGSQIKAAGGKGGLSATTKGLGGAVSDSIGSTIYKGGDGANGGTVSGGGGGGGGSTGEGGNATLNIGGAGASEDGGGGGSGVTNADGNPGSPAGGGGAGARRTTGNRKGGDGARGQIKITYSLISVTVTSGTVSYNVLPTSASEDTTSSGLNNTQVATNNGDATEDFNIKGQSSADWTLGASAGDEQYAHFFCTSGSGSPDPCDSSPAWTALTTSYQSLASGLAVSGTKRFDLKITMPTSTATTSQQSVNVTVQAVAP